MNSVISDLYYGKLHPHERDHSENDSIDLLSQSFRQDEAWLSEHLDGEAKEKAMELIRICDELDDLASFEAFRDGFILGASLVMEVCSGARAVWDEQ